MTLYRKVTDSVTMDLRTCEIVDMYEPVEPCKHGNYSRHMVDRWFRSDTGYNEEWCPGAGLEDTT